MQYLQDFREYSGQADLLHRELQLSSLEIGRLCFVKEINPYSTNFIFQTCEETCRQRRDLFSNKVRENKPITILIRII